MYFVYFKTAKPSTVFSQFIKTDFEAKKQTLTLYVIKNLKARFWGAEQWILQRLHHKTVSENPNKYVLSDPISQLPSEKR